jgi:hypothetical protein
LSRQSQEAPVEECSYFSFSSSFFFIAHDSTSSLEN